MSKCYPFYQDKRDPEAEAEARKNDMRIKAELDKRPGFRLHKGIMTKNEILAQRVYNENMLAALDDR